MESESISFKKMVVVVQHRREEGKSNKKTTLKHQEGGPYWPPTYNLRSVLGKARSDRVTSTRRKYIRRHYTLSSFLNFISIGPNISITAYAHATCSVLANLHSISGVLLQNDVYC